jgi:hypothetical protein
LSFKFNSLQWECKNTHLIMPARRIFGGFIRHTPVGPVRRLSGEFDPKFTSAPSILIKGCSSAS